MSRRDRALQAFADVMLPGDVNEHGEECYQGEPSGDAVFLYAGRDDGTAHLTIGDFREARKVLRLPAVKVHRGARAAE